MVKYCKLLVIFIMLVNGIYFGAIGLLGFNIINYTIGNYYPLMEDIICIFIGILSLISIYFFLKSFAINK